MNLQTKLIGEIVADDFRTAAVFKKHKIDFCCKGGRTIAEACESKNIDPQKIYDDLEQIPSAEVSEIDFKSFPLDLLADYVEKTHHRYVEEKIPILQAFLEKLCKVHGQRHPELLEIKTLFNESAQDLSAHLKKEELILFPFIRAMVNTKISGQPFVAAPFGTVENPISMMKHEHDTEGERFRKIAALTSDYTPPADACNTYKVTYAMLEEFENDLHRHIHIENNILFPKAIKLESELSN
ncbi:iron-sulfur cluster repair di-iron protein [Riemerella anatipestifer]|uniref:iron-sulfur cluster repair di-iron protein n=1 Tax=Riemerella anatipestifer TaxID=34085 RepID=UPI001AD66838|nr:iron-sulfur cluster repair di-iron protein [Riemerella anatipestifer]MBO4234318.1 iron-sulfur cluster repair di-iron protein [Riemerella anatipestifer]MDY3316509.1 iron-sulfur cluster repair di-iron protein [Riemerella anatipestifer]MDY3345228.1 iron-sulfur cluster repair di-iron protein [Riemerella anatipestifer]MDY3351306.1 iron-sulfur cluster repair di-iron protein [Riemerella anatipestifer]MDY3358308.1 iron-sulfur cluster repair di-iron protein [Riemerella anatipestifer]